MREAKEFEAGGVCTEPPPGRKGSAGTPRGERLRYLSGAASFRTPDTQKKLLKAEGVIVDDENRVDLKQFGWHHTLEDALEFREWFEQNGI